MYLFYYITIRIIVNVKLKERVAIQSIQCFIVLLFWSVFLFNVI